MATASSAAGAGPDLPIGKYFAVEDWVWLRDEFISLLDLIRTASSTFIQASWTNLPIS